LYTSYTAINVGMRFSAEDLASTQRMGPGFPAFSGWASGPFRRPLSELRVLCTRLYSEGRWSP
jgi:hypothetical protein